MNAQSVSVVVPTRERPQPLARCLLALAALDYPRERLEIVVVDDGGSSDLAPALLGLPEDLRVRMLRQPQGGAGSARNTGAAAGDGELIAFTDDDCAPAPGWLTALTSVLERRPQAAVGGRTINALTRNPFAAASQQVQDLVYMHYNADRADARFLASNNLAVTRSAFQAVGGFDGQRFPGAAEDRDLCDRWRAGGRPLVYEETAVVMHHHDMSLLGFCRQHVGYGRGAARFHSARSARGSGRMRDELPFHTDRAMWRSALDPREPHRVALLGLWQACNALGYGAERAAELRGRSRPAQG